MEDNIMYRKPVALSIAGSDSGGNAGIQADLRAFHTFDVHGCTVIAALTAQNQFGVRAVDVPDPGFLAEQLDAVLEVYDVGALKTGMLALPEIIEVVAGRLLLYNRVIKVFDPVMIATSGMRLLQVEAITEYKNTLLPLADLITPNIPESEELLGREIQGMNKMADAAQELGERFATAVLVKGGHASGESAVDILFDGNKLYSYTTPRILEPLSTHGTGCSLAAAITAALALGYPLQEAVRQGKAYVYEAVRTSISVGETATVLGTPKSLPLDVVREEEYSYNVSCKL